MAISAAEFSILAARAGLRLPEKGAKIAVALSGGIDSTALAFLLNRWAPGAVHAITIDHKLRPESTFEAEQLHQKMLSFGIPHTITTADWSLLKKKDHDPTILKVSEDSARQMRHQLLATECYKIGANVICMGHTIEDNIETMINRIARLSGLYGLIGITPRLRSPFISPISQPLDIVRPLLTTNKATLAKTCSELGVSDINIVNDPMNHDSQYYRAKIRPLLARLNYNHEENPFLTTVSLAKTAKNFAAYSRALEDCVKKILKSNVKFDLPSAIASIHIDAADKSSWIYSKHIAIAVISSIECWVAGNKLRAPHKQVLTTYSEILNHVTRAKTLEKGILLRRCILFPPMCDGNTSRSWKAVMAAPSIYLKTLSTRLIDFDTPCLFDGRFSVTLRKSQLDPAIVARLGVSQFQASVARNMPYLADIENLSPSEFLASYSFIIRHYSQQDESALCKLLFSINPHPALRQFRRSYRNFKDAMPSKVRAAVPVIAAVKNGELASSDLNTGLLRGAIVAFPCLGINLLPNLVSFETFNVTEAPIPTLRKQYKK